MSEFGTMDLQLLGIQEEDIKEVDASEAEVVSRVLTSRIKDILVTIRPDGITFNATCIRSITGVVHIQMAMDRNRHRLYVAPAEEFDKDSHKWCNVKDDKRISRKITGRDLGDRIYKMMGWSKGYSYRVTGYPAKQIGTEDEYLLAFDLDEFDQRLLTEKGLVAAGVEDIDLGDDASRIHADIAKEQEDKKRAREEARASGKKRRSRKKTSFFGPVEDGAFGVPRKDHVDQIIVPTFGELEKVTTKPQEADVAADQEAGTTTLDQGNAQQMIVTHEKVDQEPSVQSYVNSQPLYQSAVTVQPSVAPTSDLQNRQASDPYQISFYQKKEE